MLAADLKVQNRWCVCCWGVGIRRRTEVVDHVVPVVNNPSLLLDPTNCQASCRFCHDVVKRALEARWRAGKLDTASLDLRSDAAHTLRRKLHRPTIGPDGYAIDELT